MSKGASRPILIRAAEMAVIRDDQRKIQIERQRLRTAATGTTGSITARTGAQATSPSAFFHAGSDVLHTRKTETTP